MREILFRGKDIKGNWHIGLLAHMGNAWYISNKAGVATAYEVIPSTVGQYTGLTDKNGKKIFEGDIVKGLFVFGEISSVVIFKYGSFGIEWNIDEIKVLDPFLGLRNIECEVIGNIHDNPELLKGGDENDT